MYLTIKPASSFLKTSIFDGMEDIGGNAAPVATEEAAPAKKRDTGGKGRLVQKAKYIQKLLDAGDTNGAVAQFSKIAPEQQAMVTQQLRPESAQALQTAAAASPAPTAPATAPPTAPATAAPAAPAGANQNVQQVAAQLEQAMRQFSQQFNSQIQKYNPSVKVLMQAIRGLKSQNATQFTPEIAGVANQLIQQLQQISQSENQDAQLFSQIATNAQQLATMVGQGASSPVGGKPKPATPAVAPQQQAPAQQPGWAQQFGNWAGGVAKAPFRALRDFGRGFSGAESQGKTILTAAMGSSGYLYK